MAKNKTKMVATKKSLRQRMYDYRWIYGNSGNCPLILYELSADEELAHGISGLQPASGTAEKSVGWIGTFPDIIPGSEVLQHVEEHADHQWTFFIDVPGSDHPGIDHE